jgi:hypothetical protein
MREFEKTVISQYSNSTMLTGILNNLDQYIDPSANLEAFYRLIWDIDTAEGYGLDVWGRIVGINRILQVAAGSYFGFGEALDRTGFNQSPFYAGQPTTSNYSLSDEAFRRLIFAKAAQNITDSSIPSINQILLNLFPNRGNTYVIDGPNQSFGDWFGFAEAGDRSNFSGGGAFIDQFQTTIPGVMTLTYVFDFTLNPVDIGIVSSGVLPKPTGVLSSVKAF